MAAMTAMMICVVEIRAAGYFEYYGNGRRVKVCDHSDSIGDILFLSQRSFLQQADQREVKRTVEN